MIIPVISKPLALLLGNDKQHFRKLYKPNLVNYCLLPTNSLFNVRLGVKNLISSLLPLNGGIVDSYQLSVEQEYTDN